MEWLLLAAEAAWILGVTVWIALERRSPAATIAWIVGLAILPLAGVPIYYFLGPRRLERKRARYRGLRESLERALAQLDEQAVLPPDVARQVRLAARLDESPLLSAETLELYRDGERAFAALAEAIATARHHVHLEFYIWDPDAAGRKLRDLLVDRARAGVRIRLLLDGMGAAAGRRFFAPLLAAGGHVARFNPPRFGLWRTRLLNFRTHRKIVVCDGRVGFLGGMNVSDRQTTGRAGEPPWRDSLLRFTGEAVRTLQRAFFEDWQFATGETSLDLTCFPPARRGDYWLQIVRSGPDRAVYPVHEFLFTAIAGADRRIWITNPYVVPDEALDTALRSAAHRGVDVRLLVPRRGDSWLVQSAMRSFYDDWLASGIRLFEYQPAMLHAKTLLIDRELAVVGSANLDNRSFRLNFEIVAAIYSEAAVDQLAAWFLDDLAESEEILLHPRSERPTAQRLAEAGARLFAGVL